MDRKFPCPTVRLVLRRLSAMRTDPTPMSRRTASGGSLLEGRTSPSAVVLVYLHSRTDPVCFNQLPVPRLRQLTGAMGKQLASRQLLVNLVRKISRSHRLVPKTQFLKSTRVPKPRSLPPTYPQGVPANSKSIYGKLSFLDTHQPVLARVASWGNDCSVRQRVFVSNC